MSQGSYYTHIYHRMEITQYRSSICTPMFTETLFIVAKTGNQTKGHSRMKY